MDAHKYFAPKHLERDAGRALATLITPEHGPISRPPFEKKEREGEKEEALTNMLTCSHSGRCEFSKSRNRFQEFKVIALIFLFSYIDPGTKTHRRVPKVVLISLRN